MLKARFVLSGCFVLALLGAAWCAATYAGKPAPPPPPPPAPGKITFAVESKGFFQMNGDGSGKTAVPFEWPPDASAPVPSLGSYNGHRWWLSIRELVPNQTDLWATNGHSWIQLTASSITVDLDGIETHVRFFADPRWSSTKDGGDDRFCSVKATYWRYNPNLPNPYPPPDGTVLDIYRIIYALDIKASDLDDIAAGAPFTPLSVADHGVVTPVITAAVPLDHMVEPLVDHNWSWDGTRITFVRNNASPGAAKDLYVADVSHGLVNAANASMIYHNPSNFDVARPRWTPPGNMLADELIAFDCGVAIYTVLPHPNETAHMVTNNGYGAFWSPDGKYIAYQVPVYFVHGWTRSYDIVRIPSGGGTILTLSADSLGKNLWGWGE
jgi:hypothetical protein